MIRCFQIHRRDNTAVLLADGDNGQTVRVIGSQNQITLALTEAVEYGHKIALIPIAKGAPVIKYGIPIGYAIQSIASGDWVHLHNCASNYDERSTTLDVESGAPTDTVYR